MRHSLQTLNSCLPLLPFFFLHVNRRGPGNFYCLQKMYCQEKTQKSRKATVITGTQRCTSAQSQLSTSGNPLTRPRSKPVNRHTAQSFQFIYYLGASGFDFYLYQPQCKFEVATGRPLPKLRALAPANPNGCRINPLRDIVVKLIPYLGFRILLNFRNQECSAQVVIITNLILVNLRGGGNQGRGQSGHNATPFIPATSPFL